MFEAHTGTLSRRRRPNAFTTSAQQNMSCRHGGPVRRGSGLPQLTLIVCLGLLLGLLVPTARAAEELRVDVEFVHDFGTELVVEIDGPTDVQISPDGSLMLVTEKTGKVQVVTNYETNKPKVTEALVITQICTNVERGLGGAAFHPGFGTDNRYIYLYYTFDKYFDCDASGDENKGPINRLSRFTLNQDNTVDMKSEEVLLNTPIMPYGSHNGGNIAFGKDGYLYLSIGEGGGKSKENADGVVYPQALDMLLGKIIRITADGHIPFTNPFVDTKSARCHDTGWSGKASLKCQEIFSYGLRNPFRFAVDPNADGSRTRLFINDVGRHTWESVREGGDGFAGGNYGYPEREGPCKKKMDTQCKADKRYLDPIHWFHHDVEEGGAITGGAFYPNDLGWPVSFKDSYIYADYANGGLFRMLPGGKGCTYDQGCDPPISPYAETLSVFSELQKIVALKFGPYKRGTGGKALYAVTRGHTGNRGKQGIFRIWYRGAKVDQDAISDKNTITTAVRVPPKAIASADVTIGFPPMRVNFDGRESYDPNDDQDTSSDESGTSSSELTYRWNFDSNGGRAYTPTASFRYQKAGTYYATLTVSDADGNEDRTQIKITVENSPPRPQIIEPPSGSTFSIGEVLKLRGSATDYDESGQLRDDELIWEVRLHHGDHFHTLLEPTRGNAIDLPPAPEPSHLGTAQDSYLVIALTATDENGLSVTTETILKPKLVQFTLATNPSGMMVMANAETFRTPVTISTWDKHQVAVQAEQTQYDGIDTYAFEKWSDGYLGNERIFLATAGREQSLVANYFGGLRIDGPIDGSTFAVGDQLRLYGSARDDPPDSAFIWEVKMLSDTKSVTLLKPTRGNDIEVRCPDPINFEFAEVAVLEVTLTIKESNGRKNTRSVILHPRIVNVVFDTSPSGLFLDVNGDVYKTPKTIKTWENHSFQVEAPNQRMVDKSGDYLLTYLWFLWSDGGYKDHTVFAQAETRNKFVANFRPLALGEDTEGFTSRSAAGDFGGSSQGKNPSSIIIAVATICLISIVGFLVWYFAKKKNIPILGLKATFSQDSTPPGSSQKEKIDLEASQISELNSPPPPPPRRVPPPPPRHQPIHQPIAAEDILPSNIVQTVDRSRTLLNDRYQMRMAMRGE